MTVRDLIAALQGMPPDAPVVLNLSQSELANGKAVGRVEAMTAFQYLTECGPGDRWVEGDWLHDPEYHTFPVPVVNLTPA